jgi:hypothetical protein
MDDRIRRSIYTLLFIFAIGSSASSVSYASVPTDIVPRGSGIYEAMAVLARGGLLRANEDVEAFVGLSAPLRSRAELSTMIAGVEDDASDTGLTPAESAAMAFLQAYLDDPSVADSRPHLPASHDLTGAALGEAGAIKNGGSPQKAFEDVYGTLRLFGTTSGNAYYTAGVTNRYQQPDEYESFTTRAGGFGAGNYVDQRNGLEDAYVTLAGTHGWTTDIGLKNRRWGSAYSGDTMLSDNAPAHPGISVDGPIWLGHKLKLFRFSQVQETYSNLGKIISVGYRRIEHPFNRKLDLDLQESYASNRIRDPAILVLPYYLYQHVFIHDNAAEPNEFNYNANAGMTYKPGGESGDGMGYVQAFIDDIQAPKGFGLGNTVPRKLCYLVGYNQTIRATGTTAVVEFIHADPQTYTKLPVNQAPLAWFADDLPLGDQIGPNGEEVFTRLGQRLGRLNLAVEGAIRRRAYSDFPSPNIGLLDAEIAYSVSESQSVALRYADFRENPYPGAVTIPVAGGGANYGVYTRQKLFAVDYMRSF